MPLPMKCKKCGSEPKTGCLQGYEVDGLKYYVSCPNCGKDKISLVSVYACIDDAITAWNKGDQNYKFDFKQSKGDNVNFPIHYNSGEVECIEAMFASSSLEEFIGYVKNSAFKYRWRYKDKNGVEDLKKADFYSGLHMISYKGKISNEPRIDIFNKIKSHLKGKRS